MNPSSSQKSPRRRPFKGRKRLKHALVSLVVAGYGPKTSQFQETLARGITRSKHNGRTPGAFGGPARAKSHRSQYVFAL